MKRKVQQVSEVRCRGPASWQNAKKEVSATKTLQSDNTRTFQTKLGTFTSAVKFVQFASCRFISRASNRILSIFVSLYNPISSFTLISKGASNAWKRKPPMME